MVAGRARGAPWRRRGTNLYPAPGTMDDPVLRPRAVPGLSGRLDPWDLVLTLLH